MQRLLKICIPQLNKHLGPKRLEEGYCQTPSGLGKIKVEWVLHQLKKQSMDPFHKNFNEDMSVTYEWKLKYIKTVIFKPHVMSPSNLEPAIIVFIHNLGL